MNILIQKICRKFYRNCLNEVKNWNIFDFSTILGSFCFFWSFWIHFVSFWGSFWVRFVNTQKIQKSLQICCSKLSLILWEKNGVHFGTFSPIGKYGWKITIMKCFISKSKEQLHYLKQNENSVYHIFQMPSQ